MSASDGKTRFTALGANASVNVICERWKSGEIAVCPKCGSDLIVAFTWEAANEFGIHPGIVCPLDNHHFQVVFNVAHKAAPNES